MKYCTLFTVFVLFSILAEFANAASYTQTISVPASTTRNIVFQLSWGDTVRGTISVSGGIFHEGVDIKVTDPLGNTILNLGTVTGNTAFEFSGGFIRGNYELSIFNPSWISSKTVTITYDVETGSLIRYNYEIIGIIIVAIIIPVSALLYRRAKRKKMEKLRTCPQCGQKVPIEKTACPHCGFDISRSIRCKYCNTLYDRSLEKCPSCGAKNA